MGLWSWFKASQTPKKKRRRASDDYMFAAPPMIAGADPFTGALVIGGNVIGSIAHGIRKRRQRKREARALPTARVRRS